MVMVVADAALESRWRAGRPDAADHAVCDEQVQRVVDRLERDGADVAAHDLGDALCREVRLAGDGAQHGEAPRGDLDAAAAQQIAGVRATPNRTADLERFKTWRRFRAMGRRRVAVVDSSSQRSGRDQHLDHRSVVERSRGAGKYGK